MPDYLLKVQLAATGDRIYYLASTKNMVVDYSVTPDFTDTNRNDAYWFTDKWGNIKHTVTPIIGVYETYASLPSAEEQTVGSYALVTTTHKMYKVTENSSTHVKSWTSEANGALVTEDQLFVNKGDGDKLYRWGGTTFDVVSGGGSSGAPVIFANRIQAVSPGTPGRTKSYIYQASTDNPKIVYAVYNAGTSSYVWDTEHPVDVSSIYGAAWYDALFIETDTGRLWTVSSSDSHLQPVTPGNYTKLIVMTETFGGSGWEYAVTGSTDAPEAAANGRCLIMTSETNSSTGVTTVTPLWCLAVSDGQGGYSWDTQNPVSASNDLSSSYIYYATATGKLYMYVDGAGSLTCIARPGTGSGSNLELENVTGLSNTTYPNPVEWTQS